MPASLALRRSLGQHIRNRRIAAGLTQDALGERAGIGGNYVSEIERGTRDVPLSTLRAIVEEGLGLRLAVQFERGAAGRQPPARAPLPRGIDLIAREVAALPAARRGVVLAMLRAALRLAR